MAQRLRLERIGEIYMSNEGYETEIVEYFGRNNSTIRFNESGMIVKNKAYKNIIRGAIENPYHRNLHNKGFIGIGKHTSKDLNGVSTTSYEKWSSMFKRCYGESQNTTYKECFVDDSWDCFQDFGDWFEENFKPWMNSSWHLDKDILFKGNKIYSAETCCIVPAEVNTLFLKLGRARGKYLIGVHKSGNKFKSQISKYGVRTFLGHFDTEEEAFQAYKTAKEAHIKEVADEWHGKITEECYQALINYKVEITD